MARPTMLLLAGLLVVAAVGPAAACLGSNAAVVNTGMKVAKPVDQETAFDQV
jgi:hypothetical protein